jgi:predicted nuclease of predicted toxin-antitoxin system
MRLLIDANLSPAVASALNAAGFKATHVADEGLMAAPDNEIVAHAAANELVIISADSDFGELLAGSPGTTRPSAILLRSAGQQAALPAANLPALAEALAAGALVSIARGRMRVRALPIRPADPDAATPL